MKENIDKTLNEVPKGHTLTKNESLRSKSLSVVKQPTAEYYHRDIFIVDRARTLVSRYTNRWRWAPNITRKENTRRKVFPLLGSAYHKDDVNNDHLPTQLVDI